MGGDTGSKGLAACTKENSVDEGANTLIKDGEWAIRKSKNYQIHGYPTQDVVNRHEEWSDMRATRVVQQRLT